MRPRLQEYVKTHREADVVLTAYPRTAHSRLLNLYEDWIRGYMKSPAFSGFFLYIQVFTEMKDVWLLLRL